MMLIPKNWEKFQHYKDRCPPWIKLHRDLLNDRAFMSLPTASKALAPLMWMLASESKLPQGVFDASDDELEFRLRMPVKDIQSGRKSLIDKGFFVVASIMLAGRKQDAIPEGEGEGERETEGETEREKTARATRLPADYTLNQDWFDFCQAERQDLDPATTFAKFKDFWIAKPGKAGTKLDWFATWRNWVREERQQQFPRSTMETRESFADRDERKARERYEELTGRRTGTDNVIDMEPAQRRIEE